MHTPEGRAAGEVAAEAAPCSAHPAWGPAPSTHPWGSASLSAGERHPGQRRTDALGQSHPATSPPPQPAAWPFGDALPLPGAVQGLGSPITVIPAPQPARWLLCHGVSPCMASPCGLVEAAWVGAWPSPGIQGSHRMVPTARLQPLPCSLLPLWHPLPGAGRRMRRKLLPHHKDAPEDGWRWPDPASPP